MPFVPEEAYQLFVRAHAQNRLAHAYLITGSAGSGKRELAGRVAAFLLETTPKEVTGHPNLHRLEPESKSRRILIEQIRELEHALRMRSFFGGKKIGLIIEADRLHLNAANAFLKTLEEPPPETHLLLLSSQPEQILETILSRCIEVPLRTPPEIKLTPAQTTMLHACSEIARRNLDELPQAFQLVRQFESLMAEFRAELVKQAEADLKKEEQHYKQSTGSSAAYLDEREDHFKALVESRFIAARNELLLALEQWWADVLRQQHGGEGLDLREFAETTAVLAGRYSPAQVLRKAKAIEELRKHLSMTGVNEPLALECSFLKAFA